MKRKTSLIFLGISTLLFSSVVISQVDLIDLNQGSEYIAVPFTAFNNPPDSDLSHYKYHFTRSKPLKGYLYPTDRYVSVFAPIYFPHGSIMVQEIIAQLYDNQDDGGVFVGLYRKNLMTGKLKEVGWIFSGTLDMDSIQTMRLDVSGGKTRIDNSRYSWFLMCGFDSFGSHHAMELHQVFIKYKG